MDQNRLLDLVDTILAIATPKRHSHSESSPHQDATSHSPPTPCNPSATFTYAPLSHPRHFRLLHLTSPWRERPADWKHAVLRGTLVETSLDDAPEYFALSYTWGDSSLSDVIFINERALKITQTCAAALRRMLKDKSKITIWVDLICINQAGDTQAVQERGTQVAVMDEIYSKAVQVNVHLGEGDERTDVAVEAVNRLATASVNATVAKRIGEWHEIMGIEYMELATMVREYEEIAEEVMHCSPEFPYGKLHPLFRLPWFRRVWVFQEVVLAQQAVFYCGDHTLSFETLVEAADFTRVPYSKLDGGALHWRMYIGNHYATKLCLQLQEEGQDAGLNHFDLLVFAVTLDATRPEDKIHGMYGCAKRMGLNWPTPDYTKSVAQIYTEVTVACFQQSKDLAIMTMAIGPASEELGLPSWVPDFSRRTTATNSVRTLRIPKATHAQNKQCSGVTPCEWIIMPDERRLKVKGRRFDYVAAIGEPWQLDMATTLNGGAPGNSNSGQIVIGLLNCIDSWFDVALQRNRLHNNSTNVADELADCMVETTTKLQRDSIAHPRIKNDEFAAVSDLAHLLMSGNALTIGNARTEPPDRLAEHLSCLIRSNRVDDMDLQTTFFCHPDDDLSKYVRYGEIVLSQDLHQAIEYISPFTRKLVFRTAKNPCIGISNCNARPGDLLVVLHGMVSPCLVRPCEGGFNFIGEAFVDWIMDGEFWEGGSDKDDEWFILI